MRLRFLTLVTAILSLVCLWGKTPTDVHGQLLEFEVDFSNELGFDPHEHCRAIGTDESGNVFVAGCVASGPLFGGILSPGCGMSPTGDLFGFIAKFDSFGNFVWLQRLETNPGLLGGNPSVFVNDLVVDSNGDIVVAGHTDGDFPQDADVTFQMQQLHGFVVKLANNDGVPIWFKEFTSDTNIPSGVHNDQFNSLTVDSNGDVFAAGWTRDTQVVFGEFDSRRDLLIVKFRANDGEEIWTSIMDGDDEFSDEEIWALTVDPQGNIYATGQTNGELNCNGSTNENVGQYDAFAAKFAGSDAGEGACDWITHITSEESGSLDDSGFAIVVDPFENVYITGESENNADSTMASLGGPSFACGEPPVCEATNLFVAKLDANNTTVGTNPVRAVVGFSTGIRRDIIGFGIAADHQRDAENGLLNTIYICGAVENYNLFETLPMEPDSPTGDDVFLLTFKDVVDKKGVNTIEFDQGGNLFNRPLAVVADTAKGIHLVYDEVGNQNIYLTGHTEGTIFDVANTTQDGFVRRIEGTPIVIGDVNGDGNVTLLDVAGFVEKLVSGTYCLEADINRDGVVDLLDVQPFIELLEDQ